MIAADTRVYSPCDSDFTPASMPQALRPQEGASTGGQPAPTAAHAQGVLPAGIISMIEWIRTSRLSLKNSLSHTRSRQLQNIFHDEPDSTPAPIPQALCSQDGTPAGRQAAAANAQGVRHGRAAAAAPGRQDGVAPARPARAPARTGAFFVFLDSSLHFFPPWISPLPCFADAT